MTGRASRSRDTSLLNSREQSASRPSDYTDDEEHDDGESQASANPDNFPDQTAVLSLENDDTSTTGSVRVLTDEQWPKTTTILDIPKLLTPRSYYEPFEPPAPKQKERKVIQEFLESTDDTVDEMLLSDFTVYSDSERYPLEMCCLHMFETKAHTKRLFFDGVLSAGGKRSWVQRIPIEAIPIDGYGVQTGSTVAGQIWIESNYNKGRAEQGGERTVYYKLGEPAREYRRFWTDYLWVADFAKHFVDYLNIMEDEGVDVTMQSFISDFCTWLRRVHKGDPHFYAWKSQHPSDDFRTSVVANFEYLWKECGGVLDQISLKFHSLWKQAFLKNKHTIEADSSNKTVVTPYIYDLFAHMPFAKVLESSQLQPRANEARDALISAQHLEKPHAIDQTVPVVSSNTGRTRDIKRGDTISTQRDKSGAWKLEKAIGDEDIDRWFALVQNVKINRKGQRYYDVIWYYRPVDTICGIMKYPWKNELFLSEHCSCNEKAKIMEDEVLGVHDVHLWGTSTTSAELFCRQTYDQDSRKWMTLEEHHLRCEHVRERSQRVTSFKQGDTVLVRLQSGAVTSEPCVVVRIFIESGTEMCELRRLLRRSQVEPGSQAKPNELVWTEQFTRVRLQRLQAHCYVRFYQVDQQIPSPYDRDGVGGFFYITHQEIKLDSGPRCTPLEHFPKSLRQGLDPEQPIPKLRGLDLFCGGGNFGRGLEDSGAIEMRWINDFNGNAIHTYMANVQDLEAVQPFLGSIDLLQRHALKGGWSKMKNVPKIGDVDFISAGSPCPGFSTLTNNKDAEKQIKNRSLVASFASFVDLYRPKYGLLENVAGIISSKVNRHEDVFSQLVCAVVGLGYQLRFFVRDAYACGSPQARTRVFLIFAAPGCKLPEVPLITHSHPEKVRKWNLGILPTGEPMGEREMPESTPFRFRSALEATADLPRIYDGKTDTCIAFPDHRIAIGTTRAVRLCLEHIPIQPFGMNYSDAWFGTKRVNNSKPWLAPAQRRIFPPDTSKSEYRATGKGSSAYGRMYPHVPVNTVVTQQIPRDFKGGRQLHWQEHRVLSLLEARRAQGFRDEEVILGSLADQFRILGNSVAREVAVAIGLTIREAWVGTLYDDDRPSQAPEAVRMMSETDPVGLSVAEDPMDMVMSDDPLTYDAQPVRQPTIVRLSPLPSKSSSPGFESDIEDAVPQASIAETLVTPAQTPGRVMAKRSTSRQRSDPGHASEDEKSDPDDDDDTGTFSPMGPPKRSPAPCKDRVGAIKKDVTSVQSGQRRLSAQTAPRVLESMLRRQSLILDAFAFGAAVSTQGTVYTDTEPNRRFSIPAVGSKRKRDSTIDVETETDGTSTPTSGDANGHRPKKQKRDVAKSLTRYRVSRSNSPMPR